MELPPALRSAVDQLLEGVTLPVLREAAVTLSLRYRGEVRDGRLHISGDLAAKAYLATRLPATYAAVRASLAVTAEALPGLQPKSLLDIGAGPGTALFAAADCFDSLETATLVETSEAIRQVGNQLADAAAPVRVEWIAADLATGLAGVAPADLVTLAYVLDELSPSAIEPLVDRLWALTQDTLLVVEPGTPAGWRRILAVRSRLIAAGAHLAAPVRTAPPARSPRPTGAISRAASRAPGCTASPRAATCRGRTRNSSTSPHPERPPKPPPPACWRHPRQRAEPSG